MFKNTKAGLAVACAALSLTMPAFAQTSISEDVRDTTVETLAIYISDLFYDAERGAEMSEMLRASLSAGEFATIETAEDLSAAITNKLVSEDRHFSVGYIGPEAVVAAMAGPSADPDQPVIDRNAALRRINFGFAEVEILPGNIGYIQSNRFYGADISMDAAVAALSFIENTDAVIFDVRQNNGGPPSMVQFLISHFLSADQPTLLNTFISRDEEYPTQLWSLQSHPVGFRPDVPLIVLTSSRTGSAAEGFAYHLQALERATIMGEVTGGAGNPGSTYLTDEGFSIFIATGSARNPITNGNWEGVGVIPDVAVAAADALTQARQRLYAQLTAEADTDLERRSLEWAAEIMAAEIEPIVLNRRALRRYVGTFGQREILVVGDHLAYSRNGGASEPLIALGDHRFGFRDDERYRFVFRFDDDNRLTGLDLELAQGGAITNPLTD